MKNKNSTELISIKKNNEIVQILKKSKRMNLPYLTIWLARQPNKSQIYYGLLVNKTQFKTAVIRNRIKRQLRNILINNNLVGGIKILIKPNAQYIKKDYQIVNEQIITTINKYQNGK